MRWGLWSSSTACVLAAAICGRALLLCGRGSLCRQRRALLADVVDEALEGSDLEGGRALG